MLPDKRTETPTKVPARHVVVAGGTNDHDAHRSIVRRTVGRAPGETGRAATKAAGRGAAGRCAGGAAGRCAGGTADRAAGGGDPAAGSADADTGPGATEAASTVRPAPHHIARRLIGLPPPGLLMRTLTVEQRAAPYACYPPAGRGCIASMPASSTARARWPGSTGTARYVNCLPVSIVSTAAPVGEVSVT